MNTCKLFPILLCTLLLTGTGCSGVQQPTPTESKAQSNEVTTSAEPSQKSGEGELDQLINRIAEQARQTMRSHKTKLKDTVVEATPMWSLNYQGEVHIRVYDASGKMVLDEYRK